MAAYSECLPLSFETRSLRIAPQDEGFETPGLATVRRRRAGKGAKRRAPTPVLVAAGTAHPPSPEGALRRTSRALSALRFRVFAATKSLAGNALRIHPRYTGREIRDEATAAQ